MLIFTITINYDRIQVKHSIRDLSRGIYQILYYPELATTHKVDIKYNGFAVPDSPIVLNARNPGMLYFLTFLMLKSKFFGFPSLFS